MRVLALDTATEACSVALRTDDGVVARFDEVGRGHAEVILGMVDAVLTEADIALGDLDGLAVSVGPGSFTGVRISVSVGQGLAFGAGLSVVGVTTLEALAMQAIREGALHVLACMDARMGEVYWGCFGADPQHGVIACSPPAVGTAPSVIQALVTAPFTGPFHGVGRGFAAYPELRSLRGVSLFPGAAGALPDARDMADLGVSRLRAGAGVDPADLAPRYLRDKVALTEHERALAAARKAQAGIP